MGPKRRSVGKASVSPSASKSSSSNPSTSTHPKVPEKLTPLQSHLLALFPHAFPNVLSAGPEVVKQRIQRLKQALYERAFGAAFAEALPEDLEAYAFRWSPTRALGYCSLFCSGDIGDAIRGVLSVEENVRWGRAPAKGQMARADHHGTAEVADEVRRMSLNGDHNATGDLPGRSKANTVKVVALGGGAGAEVVAFAGALANLRHSQRTDAAVADEESTSDDKQGCRLHLHVLDIAPWQAVLSALHSALSSPVLHPTNRDRTNPLLPSDAMTLTFTQSDALSMSPPDLATEVTGAKLVTILFTLNELYAASKARTTKLLLNLTDIFVKGAMLIVVDSAGSYAAVDVGNTQREEVTPKAQGKPYPMHFLLDYTLLEAASVVAQGENSNEAAHASNERRTKKRRRWQKVHEEKARWFRLPKDVDYPLDLEDMRMQVHCYERI
jgi:25S rRNA (uracil2843-N3)-methyltransferase